MPANIKDILDNVKEIFLTDSSLETLMDYERVLSELDIYAYENWKKGELIEGPIYEKYFVTCKWMYDYKAMPDPSGGERLLEYGCEISYEKSTFEYPITVKDPSDFEAGTKMPKLVSKPVWVVTLTMPKKLMGEIEQGSIELENSNIDAEEMSQAYEENETDDVNQQAQAQGMQPAGVPAAPGMAPMPGGVPNASVI